MAREIGDGRVQEGQMAVSVGGGTGGGWLGAKWGRDSGGKEGLMVQGGRGWQGVGGPVGSCWGSGW